MKLSILSLAIVSGLVVGQRGMDKSDCSPVEIGHAPIKSTTSVDEFLYDGTYTELANNATAPANYHLGFSNLGAAVLDSSYLGMRNLQAYSPEKCAELCAVKDGCHAFNIYVQRSPTLHPGEGCPNPPASATYRCAFYSSAIFDYQATNDGQDRGPIDSNGQRFAVRIRGSNGYIKDDTCANVTATSTVSVFATSTVTETVTVQYTGV